VPLGVLAAYKQGTWIDRIVMGFSVLGFSVPVFVIGYLLIYIFAIKLNWLPVQGYQPISAGFGGFMQRLILPSVTLSVGATVALISVTIGLVIGLVAGYVRWVDSIVMRLMDGLMAIPAILLAIALVSLFRAGLLSVVVAIIVPEVPRVVRLVRSIVLSVREEPYVEAAIMAGTPTPLLLLRHVLPNTVAPLIVQATFTCANAILLEAILSFLGIGIPAETPTWGNIMAEGRSLFRVYPHNIMFPGIFLAVTVLAVNMLGDGLRDTLDPKMAKRG
jgi:peptide/nickel transport system permease protein